ncbi:hypothetical protein Hs30E_11830 [Lactococcus hodotermopsidis]|uniref:MORN repeat protein n=1 Tax=Pseudolactococcus hodotermopsidis TaxID=2709157 RepID=A0A6A0BBA6_9LACT|nr:hypothetical protein [Lactococcus hodotermopsidis]GFH42632.1 hypothetical protein Hs30E_11830 [Lactococcus hodotermopsidis]
MGQTYKEKLTEIEQKRQAQQEKISNFDSESPEILETTSQSAQTISSVTETVQTPKKKVKLMTVAIFVSFFVILIAQVYALDVISFKREVTQTALDKSFTYKGSLKKEHFSGKATVTDNSGNTLTATFKDGRITGSAKYDRKNAYVVEYISADKARITLANHIVVTQENANYTLKSDTFSYDGEWRFGGTWQGTMTFSNGAVYKGTWKNGLPNGQGLYTPIIGEPIKANFKFGVPEE